MAGVSVEFEHSVGNSVVPDGVCFHPNGENFLYCAGWNIGIGDLTNPHSQRFLRGHNGHLTCLTISPSGRYVASGQEGENSDIFVWDFETSEKIYSFEEHDYKIQSLSFSHDEKILASIGNTDDGNLIVWDLSNGAIIASAARIPAGTNCVMNGGFVRDIKRRDTDHYQICTGARDGVTLWDLDPYTGDMTSEKLAGDPRASIAREVTALSFSHDKELLFAATSSGDYMIGSLKARRIKKTVQATKQGLGAISCYRGGLVVGGGDGTLTTFDDVEPFTARSKTTLDGSAVIGVSLSSDHLEVISILASTAAGSVYRVNLETMSQITISESHTSGVVAVAFPAHTSERFASASRDGSVRIWDLVDYAVISTGKTRNNRYIASPVCICYADYVISGWTDGSVIAHDPDTGDIMWSIGDAHQGEVSAIVLSHNNRFLLTGGEHGEIRLWEMRSRDLVSHMKEHTQRVTGLQLFESDTTLSSSSKDRSILRWDLRTEKRLFSHIQRMGAVNALMLSKDQTHVVSVGQEKRMTYWDINAANPVHAISLDGENDEGKCIAR
ncbi:unnamed protein product [Ectocarpus fasciculatus]